MMKVMNVMLRRSGTARLAQVLHIVPREFVYISGVPLGPSLSCIPRRRWHDTRYRRAHGSSLPSTRHFTAASRTAAHERARELALSKGSQLYGQVICISQ